MTLVDAVQKKAAFQRQAAIELGLANVEARHARVEALSGQYGIITARAFAELAEFVRLTRPLLASGGRWLAMKGQLPERELASLPADVRVAGLQPLKVPGLDAARHLVILEAS